MPQTSQLVQKLMEKLTAWVESGVVMLPNLILATIVMVFGYFLSGWVRKGVRRLVHQISDNAPISGLLATVSRVGVMTLFLFIALGLLDLDKTVTSLLAGVGVVGLALGFAFQDIAANFMSGFMMAMRRAEPAEPHAASTRTASIPGWPRKSATTAPRWRWRLRLPPVMLPT